MIYTSMFIEKHIPSHGNWVLCICVHMYTLTRVTLPSRSMFGSRSSFCTYLYIFVHICSAERHSFPSGKSPSPRTWNLGLVINKTLSLDSAKLGTRALVPHYEYHKADSFSRFISPDSFLQGLASAAGVDISNGNSVYFKTTLNRCICASVAERNRVCVCV